MASALAQDIQTLIAATDFARLRSLLVTFRPTEIASAFLELAAEDQLLAFRSVPRDLAASVFEYLPQTAQRSLVKTMGQEDVAGLLNNMAPDDRTVLFGELPANVTKHLLSLLTPEERAEAVTLLGYAPGTIGRLMPPHYIAVREDWTVGQVMEFVREHGQDRETLNSDLAVEPELLCMDEPFSALDVLSAEALRGELLELRTTGKIPTKVILMVTHNIEEAVLMGDRIVVMEKDPGRVIAEVPVPFAHPRHRTPEFQALVDHVSGLLAGQTKTESEELGSAPGQPGRTRGLPSVTVNELAGFLEHLMSLRPQRADIARLGGELHTDSDHVLRLAEAASRLGFVVVDRGDITETPLGETFAEASIQARKEIFATRVRRVPIVSWLLTMLRSADRHELDVDVVQSALGLDFHPDEAEQQLAIAIDWGRYAEVIAYDHSAGMIYLETDAAPKA